MEFTSEAKLYHGLHEIIGDLAVDLRAEMEAVLTPSAYIGRCPEQVDAFLAQVTPLLSQASAEKPEINL